MADIEIYTTSFCPYCWRAKSLLQRKGAAFREIDVGGRPELRSEMTDRSGRRTVPQIFIDGRSVGGSDELYELERVGRLDALLNAGADS